MFYPYSLFLFYIALLVSSSNMSDSKVTNLDDWPSLLNFIGSWADEHDTNFEQILCKITVHKV
jgi:hypothetical protein